MSDNPYQVEVAEDTPKRKQRELRYWISTACDHLFFAAALFLTIPAIPSNEERYYFSRAVVPCALLMSASRTLAIVRGEESLVGWILKVAIVVAFGFGNYARVFGP
jgi:hypothetical protein